MKLLRYQVTGLVAQSPTWKTGSFDNGSQLISPHLPDTGLLIVFSIRLSLYLRIGCSPICCTEPLGNVYLMDALTRHATVSSIGIVVLIKYDHRTEARTTYSCALATRQWARSFPGPAARPVATRPATNETLSYY